MGSNVDEADSIMLRFNSLHKLSYISLLARVRYTDKWDNNISSSELLNNQWLGDSNLDRDLNV